MNKAEQLIACLEGEIAKRDARIVELEDLCCEWIKKAASTWTERDQLRAELSAIKAREPFLYASVDKITDVCTPGMKADYPALHANYALKLYAAPVSEAKAQPVSAAYCSVTCIESVQVGQLRYEEGRTYDVKGHSPAGVDVYADDAGSFSTFNNPAFNKHFNVATYRTAPVSTQAEAKAQGVAMPDALYRAFITGESCDGVYRVVIQSETLKEMQAVHRWLSRLSAAPVQQVSVPDGWKLVPVDPTEQMVQVVLDSGLYHDDEVARTVLIEEYKSMLAAAPAAPAADAGLTASEWTKDAEEWGGALNYAAWEFINECPEKSALLFNNTKGPLRAAIMKYAELVSANVKDSSHD